MFSSPSQLERPSVQALFIADSDAGIRKTCELIYHLIELGSADTDIIYLVRKILSETRHLSATGQSQDLTRWVVDHVRYQKDDGLFSCNGRVYWSDDPTPLFQCREPVEILYTARQIWQNGYGDCDDYTILLGAMHRILGIPIRLAIIAQPGADADRFSHVYLQVHLNGYWIPIDPVADTKWGWQFPNPTRMEVL